MLLAALLALQLADSVTVRVPIAMPAGADSAAVTLTLTPGPMLAAPARPADSVLVFRAVRPTGPVTLQACGRAFRAGLAGPASCNRIQSYASAALVWAIAGVSSGIAQGVLDSSRVSAYLTAAAGGRVCHAEVRDYFTGTLVRPEPAPCDTIALRLAWYATMDSTGRGTAPAVTVATWNRQQYDRGRALPASARSVWLALVPLVPSRISVMDAPCCTDAGHAWPTPPALEMLVSIWRRP